MHTSILTLGLVAFFQGATASKNSSNSGYSCTHTYDSSNFFEAFEFFNADDPTNGFVEYVDADTANSEGLAGFVEGQVYMGVDYKTKNPSKGRKSVRVTSHDTFTHGLFIADIAHMPGSIPGIWPAYWMFGSPWPTLGEIDIIEGVNTQTENKITLHTGPGCRITNEGSDQGSTLVNDNCNAGGANEGCGQTTYDNQNYGDGFNDIGGGVYAMEWTSDHISVWFFKRGRIPQDIQSDNPDPASWGAPSAKFNGGQGCNIDDHFKENNIVFTNTFCGDWAGSPDVWGKNPETSSLGSCNDYVASNPADFKNAYWLINSIKVYSQGESNNGGSGGNGGNGGNSGEGNSGEGNSGNGNSGNGNSGNGNSGNGNSGNGNSGNGNTGNNNSGNNNSGDNNSGNGNSGNGQSGNGDGYNPGNNGDDQTYTPPQSPPSQEGGNVWYIPTSSQKDQKNGEGSSQQGQSYDNGQWHGPGAYSKPKVHSHGGSHRGSTSWDGKGWRVGSRRSMAKRYLA